ncbi:AAA family ATPase [Sporosarcina thermotolerans]|uniref:AAA family ATPase n=1 Tax=Sporosarcina thermotolerans TaxID=633404 RepID=A0AAW9A6D7_9BACL|nr:AAA family ATPase [Sporosarcina thermotolerans]MDW0116168.1 AAA family ATPase [Sporosarcina thermotolerans]
MNILKPEIKYTEMRQGERGRIVTIPDNSYEVLQNDFTLATHLKSITELNLKKVKGIYIQADSEIDAVIAALYSYKKFSYDNEMGSENEIYDYDDDFDYDDYEDYEDIEWLQEKWADGTFCHVPILTGTEFVHGHIKSPNPFMMDAQYAQKIQLTPSEQDPYWKSILSPLIINIHNTGLEELKRVMEMEDRFYILFEARADLLNAFSLFMDVGDGDDRQETVLNQFQKDFIFEADIEFIQVSKAPMPYLTALFNQTASELGKKIAPSVNCEEVITQLVNYRKQKFESIRDIERIIHKALRYSVGNSIGKSEFERIFLKDKVSMEDKDLTGKAIKELNKLIGLKEVKQQLLRIVDRMKLAEMRKQAGYPTIDHHMAAVFMGNPGTAKTTVARIFGQLLFDSKVLTNNVFIEVSRKDLIGQYVGWTSHKVQEVFDKGKGGTIFVDEAYSLVNKKDGYSDEAFSAIIQHMENNPDTLVIFAGYTDEMLDFIQSANPGLQSRLTNIIQFEDYEEKQLQEIFYYHVERSGYELESKKAASKIVGLFIKNLNRLDGRQFGNGRMMRKLLSSSVGYMAQRKPKNINLLLAEDIQSASDELLETEAILQMKQKEKRVGFKTY